MSARLNFQRNTRKLINRSIITCIKPKPIPLPVRQHLWLTLAFPRREPTPRDVQIEILYCGICHSDLHYARNEWSSLMQTVYPCVPGHEIVGRVTKVGSAVTKFKAGRPGRRGLPG